VLLLSCACLGIKWRQKSAYGMLYIMTGSACFFLAYDLDHGETHHSSSRVVTCLWRLRRDNMDMFCPLAGSQSDAEASIAARERRLIRQRLSAARVLRRSFRCIIYISLAGAAAAFAGNIKPWPARCENGCRQTSVKAANHDVLPARRSPHRKGKDIMAIQSFSSTVSGDAVKAGRGRVSRKSTSTVSDI